MKGHFITFEGGEGSGKTTVIQVVEKELKRMNYSVLSTREPGGIKIAEEIRKIILHPDHQTMDAKTEALLYAAARRQHLVEKIIPALNNGQIVLCDRYLDSSLAYQGFARGLGIQEVFQINQFATEGYLPSLTLLFDVEPEEGFKRIQQNKVREVNRLDLEAIDFHHKVYEGYHQLKEIYSNRIKVVDANQSIEKVARDVLDSIISHIQ